MATKPIQPHHVSIPVVDGGDLEARFALSLADGSIFIRQDHPPAPEERVILRFVAANGLELGQVSGVVARSRPAMRSKDPTAGMEVQLTSFDDATRAIMLRARETHTAANQPDQKVSRESLAPLVASDVPGPVIGIDLGTTNSCVAIAKDGEAKVLLTPQGHDLIPSIIHINPKREVSVGIAARERMALDPARAIYGAKRFIGRPFAGREVRTYGHFFSYAFAEGKRGLAAARVDDVIIPLEVASGYLLSTVRKVAEKALGEEVHRAVVTVPAYFGEGQRQSVRDAGRLAGLHVERVVSEPTAAAVAYGFGRGLHRNILVYDLGGGTFDVSLLRVDGNVIEVLGTDGDPFLGGSDFDDRLIEFVLMSVERKHSINLREDATAVQRIRLAVEAAKRDLSDSETTTIDVPHLLTPNGPIHVRTSIERRLFEDLTEDLVMRTLDMVQKVLDQAGFKSEQVDEVILVGGQSRSPHVRRMLTARFGNKLSRRIHPDHAVALGAALIGEVTTGPSTLRLEDILSVPLRITRDGLKSEVIIPKGTKLPAKKQIQIASTSLEFHEFRVTLLRGEHEKPDDNELLGTLSIPSSVALALTKTTATVTVEVSVEGLLHATMVHPTTGKEERLEMRLPEEGPKDDEVLEMSDLDVVEVG